MTEVVKVLGWEPTNSIEKQRADGASRDLEMLKAMVLAIQQEEQAEGPPDLSQTPKPTMDDFDSNPEGDSFIEEVF